MRKGVGIVVLVTATMGGALGGPRALRKVSELELFQVTEIEIEGGRYLGAEEVRRAAAVPVGASLWDDLAPIVERLKAHPGIRDAEAERKLPRTLFLRIEEREPVALVPNPTLTPVDADGTFLPFDPVIGRVDLPLLQVKREGADDGALLSPAQIRQLAVELDRLRQIEPNLLASVSDVALDPWGDVVLHLEEPRVSLRYQPPFSPRRVREALIVLQDALARNPRRPPVEVDLRFAEQVVVRFPPPRGR